MTVIRNELIGVIFKKLVLSNTFIYLMTQKTSDGTVTSSWRRIDAYYSS